MTKLNFSIFFQNQKSRLESFKQKKNIEFLDSKFNVFLDELRKIDAHLDYESDLEHEEIDKNFIAKLKLDSYLPKLNRKILFPLKEKSLCIKFFQLLICFNFSYFSHINENIYDELLFKMISLAAENFSCGRNEFIRQIYEFKCEEANSDKVQEFIKKMLQNVKAEENNDKKADEKNWRKNEDPKDSDENSKPDSFAETENDERGIKIVNGLLFQYNICNSKDLQKNLSKIGIVHFFFWIIFPLALSALGIFFCLKMLMNGQMLKIVEKEIEFLRFSSGGITYTADLYEIFILCIVIFCFIAFSNFIIFFFRKQRIKYLKKAVSKILSVCEISEDYIYKKILPRYGTKIKKLLQ